MVCVEECVHFYLRSRFSASSRVCCCVLFAFHLLREFLWKGSTPSILPLLFDLFDLNLPETVGNCPGSCMEYHPRFQQFLRKNDGHIFKRVIEMRNFGGETRKLTILYGPSEQALDDFQKYERKPKKPKSEHKLVWARVENGKRKVTGHEKILKSSQEYPKYFGETLTFWEVL